MKQLSKDEMKMVMGGYNLTVIGEEGGGDAICKTVCFSWNKQKMAMDQGTCSSGTVRVGQVTLPTCDCSLSGGTDCYN